MKHTPGPWEPWNSIGSRSLKSWRVGERQSTPGVVRPIAVVSGDRRSSEEEIGNAYLIAAAPELLAALEDLFAFVQGRCDPYDYEYEAVMKAIMKAKGEQPE